MRDRQPLTINGSTYQLTQTVTNRAESSYENVLTIKKELPTVIEHHYSCIISNINGNASKHINLTGLFTKLLFSLHSDNTCSPLRMYHCNCMIPEFSPPANPLNVAIMQEENPTAGSSFTLNCSLTLPQWAKAFEEPNIEFLNPVDIADDGFIMIERSEEMLNDGFNYITTLKFTTLQIFHSGQYKCQAGFRSHTAENEISLIVKSKWKTLNILLTYLNTHMNAL